MSKAEKPNNGTFQISAESNFGTIGYKLTVTASQEQVLKLASPGLEKLVSGKPSGRADMVLGYNPSEKNDVKRPDTWKRSSIQYTVANGQRLADLFTEFLAKEGFANVEVQTFQQGSNAAMDTAKATLAAMEAAGTAMGVEGFVAKWAHDVIGYAGDDLSAANVEFLAAIAANNAKLPKPASK